MRELELFSTPLALRLKSRSALLALVVFITCVPAFAQMPPPDNDPLARIRAQPPAPSCSVAEPTLCAEAAPKIIANAMSKDSTIEANLRELASGEGGHAMGAPPSPSAAAEVRAEDWAYSALRAAGLDAQSENYTLPPSPAGSAPGQQVVRGQNIVAEIRGREKPDEIVILGAHLDISVPGNDEPGENYDAAVVIEAARDIFATGLVPRRTIRFVLFTGAEPSAPGSWAYIQAHLGDMDHTIAAIIFDEGTGHVNEYSLGGRHDVDSGVREALAPLDSLGPVALSYDAPFAADNFDFLLEGVPSLLATRTEMRLISNVSDVPRTLDAVDIQELRRNAAIAGVTAFDVAEDVAPLGPRLSRTEIDVLLKQTGLDEQMKVAGTWAQWANGQRGRQP